MKVFPNKIPAPCCVCRTRLAPRAGYSYRTAGWQSVCRSSQCMAKAGVLDAVKAQQATEQANQARTLTQEGDRLVVRTPYDPSALPLLRGLPGARWDPSRTAWTCSAAAEDRTRVLEVAGRLGLAVDSIEAPEVDDSLGEALEKARTLGMRPYQIEGIEWLTQRTRALLGDDMGLGKTAQVLLSLPYQGCRAIVVCPASLKHVWRDEAARWRPDLAVHICKGRGSFQQPESQQIVVINYDILPTEADLPEEGWAGVVLVADEAVALKNGKAKRTAGFRAMANRCRRTWLLTGTPLANRPPDLWGVLASGQMAHTCFAGFNQFAGLMGGYRQHIPGVRHPVWAWGGDVDPAVPERLRRVMLRRTKGEVLKELPAKTHQWIAVNDTPKRLLAKLDKLAEEVTQLVEKGELPSFERMSAIRRELAEARVKAAEELVTQYEDAGTPLVLFSAHRKPVDTIGARPGWDVICGDTPALKREEAVRKFQAGQLKGLAITIQAGGTGLTLTRASHVLFVDLAWRPTDNAQAEDRVCRIGQTANAILIQRMVTDHPVDRRVAELLAEKQKLIEASVENEAAYQVPEPKAPTLFIDEETEDAWAERIAKLDRAAREAHRDTHRDYVDRVLDRQAQRGYHTDKPLTDEIRDAIRLGYQHMLGQCDGAKRKDGVGFNKSDAGIAHKVNLFDLDDDNALRALWAILRHYPGQLGSLPVLFRKS